MTAESLGIIDNAMAELGIEYSYIEYEGKSEHYFTGEYQEAPQANEDGLQDNTFILNGFSRTTWEALESAKAKIKNKFHPSTGLIVTTESGHVVAIFYEQSLVVPTGDAELKRIQINLSVKEWSVN